MQPLPAGLLDSPVALGLLQELENRFLPAEENAHQCLGLGPELLQVLPAWVVFWPLAPGLLWELQAGPQGGARPSSRPRPRWSLSSVPESDVLSSL